MKRHLYRKYPGLRLIPGIVLAIIALAIISLGYGIYLEISRPTTSESVSSMRIIEASLEVADPNVRALDYEAEKISTVSGADERYLVRDNNTSFFERCQYPVAIWPVGDEAAQSVMDSSDETLKQQHKQVAKKWYRVWLGTHWQSDCASAIDEDDAYLLDLQKYVLENLSELN